MKPATGPRMTVAASTASVAVRQPGTNNPPPVRASILPGTAPKPSQVGINANKPTGSKITVKSSVVSTKQTGPTKQASNIAPKSDQNSKAITKPGPLQPLTFADYLDKSLVYLWWPLKLAMRVPFEVVRIKSRIDVHVNRTSPWFFSACLMTGALWITWFWLSFGAVRFWFRVNVESAESADQRYRSLFLRGNIPERLNIATLHIVEVRLLRRYYGCFFLVWGSLFHASLASIHLLYTCEDHSNFIKNWYAAVDTAKLKPIKNLVRFIAIHLVIIGIFSIVILGVYFERRIFPDIHGAANLMALVMFRPFLSDDELIEELANEDEVYFSRFAPIGVSVYIFAVISSRLNLLFFLVFTKVFKNSATLMNNRIQMALGQRRIQGENAIHLDYVNLYKDHLQISWLGKEIGVVFGMTVVAYYTIQMLCITLELSLIAYFDFEPMMESVIPGTDLYITDDPFPLLFNSIMHFVISLSSFLYVSYVAANAGETAMEAFDIVRRQGLSLSVNERERNFVRSMWYSGGVKNPILIQPSSMFTLDRNLIVTVLGTSFFYFILMWQFRHNQERDANRLRRHSAFY